MTETTNTTPADDIPAGEAVIPPSPGGEDVSVPPSSSGEDMSPPSSSGPDIEQTAPGDASSLEDVISSALESPEGTEVPSGEEEDEKAAPPDEPVEGAKDQSSDEEGAEDPADPDDKELEALKPKARERFKKLLAQRNEARDEVKSLSKDAQGYQAIRGYMAQNNLQDKEVVDLFQLGADLKSGDPERIKRFLERAKPYIDQARELAGESVPADMQEQVESGELTEDAAKSLAQAKARALMAEQRAQSAQEQATALNQQTMASQIVSAASREEAKLRQSDPDYDAKKPAIERTVQALVAEKGLPATPEVAVAYVQAAHKEVSAWVQSTRPAPKPIRSAPYSQTAPPSGLAQQNASLESIIDGVLQG